MSTTNAGAILVRIASTAIRQRSLSAVQIGIELTTGIGIPPRMHVMYFWVVKQAMGEEQGGGNGHGERLRLRQADRTPSLPKLCKAANTN